MNDTDILIEDFTKSPTGKCFALNTLRKIGPDQDDRLFFEVYMNLTYDIYIHDPKYFLINNNPVGMPILRKKIDPQTDPSHFYRAAVADVEELDLPDDP